MFQTTTAADMTLYGVLQQVATFVMKKLDVFNIGTLEVLRHSSLFHLLVEGILLHGDGDWYPNRSY